MRKCPVCQQSADRMVCKNCGFDGSLDREQYPTLGKFPTTQNSAAALRHRHLEQNQKRKGMLRCSSCGQQQFYLSPSDGAVTCCACGNAETQNWERALAIHGLTRLLHKAQETSKKPRSRKSALTPLVPERSFLPKVAPCSLSITLL